MESRRFAPAPFVAGWGSRPPVAAGALVVVERPWRDPAWQGAPGGADRLGLGGLTKDRPGQKTSVVIVVSGTKSRRAKGVG